jgi:hypothetical protein
VNPFVFAIPKWAETTFGFISQTAGLLEAAFVVTPEERK